MTTTRSFSAAISLPNKLLITGGDTDHGISKTSNTVFANGTVTNGPIVFPQKIHGHCLVEYHGTIYSTGGRTTYGSASSINEVWRFNEDFKQIDDGPNMKKRRFYCLSKYIYLLESFMIK